MFEVETKSKKESRPGGPPPAWSAKPASGALPRRRLRMIPLLITLPTLALAAILCLAMWDLYMVAPWTRDGTVRA